MAEAKIKWDRPFKNPLKINRVRSFLEEPLQEQTTGLLTIKMAAVKVYGSLLREDVNQNSGLGASTLCAQHGLNRNNCRDLLAQLITNASTKGEQKGLPYTLPNTTQVYCTWIPLAEVVSSLFQIYQYSPRSWTTITELTNSHCEWFALERFKGKKSRPNWWAM